MADSSSREGMFVVVVYDDRGCVRQISDPRDYDEALRVAEEYMDDYSDVLGRIVLRSVAKIGGIWLCS